jgi:hypothetical protein
VEDGFVDISALLDSGVYMLEYHGEVVYIGRTKCGVSRIGSHTFQHSRLGKIPFDKVWFKPCQKESLSVIERQLIKKYSPRYNIHGVTPNTTGDPTKVLKLLGIDYVPLTPLQPILRRI